jgi:hypothetical protein
MKPQTRRTISLGFSEEKVFEGQHICYIFNDDEERRRVMAKYLESGRLANEKLLYLVDVITPEEMLRSLEDLGVDVRTKPAALTVEEAGQGYCPQGVFNSDEMLQLVRDFYHEAVDTEGYAGARGTGEMSWCLVKGRADEVTILEYEARLNLLIAEHPYTACCQYDARRFEGHLIMDVLAVHPVMIVRGQLVKNPFFVPPDIFLNEYHARQRK